MRQLKGFLFGAIALALLTAPLVACSNSARGAGEERVASTDTTPDAVITTKVETKLVADPTLNPFEIKVETSHGVVSLSGTVGEAGDRDQAERVAMDTGGVRSVINNIEVNAEGAAKTGASAAVYEAKDTLTDAAITAAVKAKLVAADGLTGLHIDVDTAKGVVVLSGKVESETQKRHAEKLARDTHGVADVLNNLKVERG